MLHFLRADTPSVRCFNFLQRVSFSYISTKLCVVPERAYLKLSGLDTKKFLQGVTTNDLSLLKVGGDCLATAFLTPKGRILSDAIIYDVTGTIAGSGTEPTVIIETHSSFQDALSKFLSLYRLRAKLTIQIATNFRTRILFSEQKGNIDIHKGDTLVINVVDPRHSSLGNRLLYQTDILCESSATDMQFDVEIYKRYRMLNGLAEGPELEGLIPLEANLDLLNYISFSKGCYVGQELIARTKHKGLVRKRIVPFLSNGMKMNGFNTLESSVGHSALIEKLNVVELQHKNSHSLLARGAALGLENSSSDSDVKLPTSEEDKIGEILSLTAAGDIGMAKVSLKYAYGARSLCAVSDDRSAVPIAIYKPKWWPEVDTVTGKRLDDPSTY